MWPQIDYSDVFYIDIMKHTSIPFKTVEVFVPYVSEELIDLVFLVTGILSSFVLLFPDYLRRMFLRRRGVHTEPVILADGVAL